MKSPHELASAVKATAMELGFSRVGIAPAGEVADGSIFEQWLAEDRHGSMDYLARNVDKRRRPDRLVPGARCVICLAVGCAPAEEAKGPAPLVARYARGRDYHKVLKRRCRALMDRIRQIAPDFAGRAFVDSAPVLERSLARQAGLGWVGRNRCLIVPGLGSYVLLCEIICNLPLPPDGPVDSACGDCGACVEACPTGALSAGGFDARRCVSYLTIEHSGPIDREFWPLLGRCVAGCDVCQQACPHNRDAPASDGELQPSAPPLGGADVADVLAWTEMEWDRATRGSALRRVRLEMFLRNAILAAGNSAGLPEAARLIGALEELSSRRSELREPIEWALRRLRGEEETGPRRA